MLIRSFVFFCAVATIGLHHFAVASDLPPCRSDSSDSDGDGYGWENNASCRVVVSASVCEDRGDYPWGWNPVTETSCLLTGETQTTATECVDTDGDGWGWDGTTTCIPSIENTSVQCIDSDGDGWGWDGVQSCRVEQSSTQPTSAQNNPDDPAFDSWRLQATYLPLDTDANWRACGGEVYENVSSAWANTDTGCVSACGDFFLTPDQQMQFVPDANYPGYGTLSGTEQSCLYGPYRGSESIAGPVYYIDSDRYRKRVAFTRMEVEDFYTGGKDWQCTEQTRDTIDGNFNTGRSASLSFNADGTASYSIGGEQVSGVWNLRSNGIATRIRRVQIRDVSVHTDFFSNILFEANPVFKEKQLQLYQSAFNRLNCEQVESLYPYDRFSIDADAAKNMFETASTLPRLTGEQLDGRTLQCGALYSDYDGNYEYSSLSSTATDQEIIVPVEFVGYQNNDSSGAKNYDFGDNFGTASEFDYGAGSYFSLGSSSFIARRYSENLSLLTYDCCYVHGGGSRRSTVWACRDIGDPSRCVDEDGDGFGWNGFGSCTP